jgi:predicted GIY-YIG superfamily endonuclease
MTTNIYILKLQNDKWYIGKSDNPEKRFLQHKNGSGSAWTSRYKAVELFKVIENVSSFLEDAFTKEYMSLYGIDNVRGGSYTQIILPDEQKKLIQREIWSMKNLCNNCGSSEHWVRSCPIIEEEKPIIQINKKPIIQINTKPIIEFFSKLNTNISIGISKLYLFKKN